MFGGVIFNLSPFSVFLFMGFWLHLAVLLLAWSYFELVAAGRCYNGAAARRTSRTSILDWDLHFVSGGRSSYGVNATNLGHSVFTIY